jgi:hypothetical protein
MVTLEQVKLLESKVGKAIDFVDRVTAENTFLKEKLETYQKRIDELEVLIQRFKDDQGRIEEGIISALDRLNAFEAALEKTIAPDVSEEEFLGEVSEEPLPPEASPEDEPPAERFPLGGGEARGSPAETDLSADTLPAFALTPEPEDEAGEGLIFESEDAEAALSDELSAELSGETINPAELDIF